MSIFSRANVILRGNVNDLLSKIVDLNSSSAVRQYVRDLEEQIQKLKVEIANQQGQLITYKRQHSELASQLETDKATVTKLLTAGTNQSKSLATSKAAIIITHQKQLDALKTDEENQQLAVESLKTAVQKLVDEHDQMVTQVRNLENKDRDSKAKEAAAKAINQAAGIIATGSSISIDDVTEKINARNDRANAQFEVALGGLDTGEDVSNNDEVQALLESLKPKELNSGA